MSKKAIAKDIQVQLANIRTEISDAELQVSLLNIREKVIAERFEKAVNDVYKEKYGVDRGDIIMCDGEEFRFLRFDGLSNTPVVNYKLKSKKWSRKEQVLWMYDWKTKETISLGKLKL